MLPFSRSRPPNMPATANTNPPKEARSGRRPPGLAGFGAAVGGWVGFIGLGESAICSIVGKLAVRRTNRGLEDASAELHDPVDHFLGRFADAQDLSGGQRDHRIRGG